MRITSANPKSQLYDPVLSLLIPVLVSRQTWKPLVKKLRQQIKDLDLPPGSVEIVTVQDDGEATSGVKRQRLTNLSRGKYIAFIDDDDDVSDDYVKRMMEGCCHETDPDVVTFDLEMTFAGQSSRKEVWTYHNRYDDRSSGKMAANHLCAWKKELATMVGWCPFLGYGDDQLWYKPLIALGVIKTEYHINSIIYRYQFDPTKTANQRQRVITAAHHYVGSGLQCYKHDNKISIQLGNVEGHPIPENDLIAVVTWLGHVIEIPPHRLHHYHTVRIV